MKSAFSAALLCTAAIMTLPACSKRDREEVKKTSDGSETFKYVPRDPNKFIKQPADGSKDKAARSRKDNGEKEPSKTHTGRERH